MTGVAQTMVSGPAPPDRASGADQVRAFAENAAISFRALYRWLTPSSYLATRIIGPVEEMLVFALLAQFAGGVGTVQYVVIGNCVVQVCLGGLAAANTVAEERGLGTLPLLLASPVNRLVNYLQRGTLHILDSLVSVSIALLVGVTLFGIDLGHADWVSVIAALLVATVSSVCLGLLLGSLAMAYANFFLLLNLLWLVMLLATGVNIPVAALPEWVQPISYALPFTRSLQAARDAIAGAPLPSVAGPLLTELALAAGYLLLGYAILLRLERIARRRGTYELT